MRAIVEKQAAIVETFSVTAYANTTVIEMSNIINLGPKARVYVV